MCVAVPVRVASVGTPPLVAGEVEADGERRPCNFAYLPDARPGDWVLVRAGFAVVALSDEDAAASLAAFEQLGLTSRPGGAPPPAP